ncbi:MAG: RHS repeat-associated core domain-containing protein [Bacteroidia bacterium]|nr:RHS repeat-associated core domain-containing protein [Bacteroidia bacterium]
MQQSSVYTDSLRLEEWHLYGSSRIGIYQTNKAMAQRTVRIENGITTQVSNTHIEQLSLSRFYTERGAKRYELTNHLGNVLTVVTDKKLPVCSGTSVSYYIADVVSATDYSPFGAPLAGRTWQGAEYRYGFNTQERDDELKGSGNSLDFGERIYDPRLGRFLSIDPLTNKFPMLSPCQFAGNSPILNIDIDGLEPLSANEIIKKFSDGKTAIGYKMTVHVDQPGTGGDRDSYEISLDGVDVGHTFITLEKINDDGTITKQTFGWYPSAELNPMGGEIQSKGVIMNDEGHQYDASKTFNLTEEQFNKTLDYVKQQDGKDYNLDTYNCTDFGQGCSNAGGNKLPDTQGSWPGGAGSNPGDLGEDLKKTNTGTSGGSGGSSGDKQKKVGS